MARKFFVEVSIFITIVLSILVVGYSGFLAYRGLITIVGSAKEESNISKKLLLLKEVFSKISDAENNVRSYALTKDDYYLSLFYSSVKSIDDKIDKLTIIAGTDVFELQRIDSLSGLIEQKYDNFNRYLNLYDEKKITSPLSNVSANLKQNRSVSKKVKAAVVDSLPGTNIEKKKSNLFSRIFAKKEKKNPERQIVETLPELPAEAVNINYDKISLTQIESELEKVRSEQLSTLRNLRSTELEITRRDKIISAKIRTLIAGLENNEVSKISEQKSRMESQFVKTNKAIAIFCVVASILLLIVSLTIIRYVKKNNAYGRALKMAKNNAEQLAAAKEKFLANMSHELRTPLNAIIGFSEQMIKTDRPTEHERSASIVNQSANHLLNIINDLLDHTKLQSGKFELEIKIFNVENLIAEAIALVQPMLKNKPVKLNFDINKNVPVNVLGDRTKLKQILLNLLSNAIKFTENGSVDLKVSSVSTQTETVLRFVTKDTGIGITEEKLETVFNEFEQAESSTSRKYGGTGLGLSITRKLVDLQMGSINLRSELNKGTTVEVILPYKIADPKIMNIAEPVFKIDLSVLKEKSILIVDDEEFNRDLLTVIFTKWNVRSQTAANGKEALEILKHSGFDLILMDIRMGGLSGIEVTEQLRELKNTTPIIAVTASATKTEREIYKNAGMNEVLEKPFMEIELYKKTLAALGIKESEESENQNPMTQPENNKIFDLRNLIDLAGNDEAFIKDMILTFIDSSNEAVEKITFFSQGNNWKGITQFTHKLLAPARHIKANAVAVLLDDIETQLKTTQEIDKGILDKVKELEKEIEILNKELQKEIASLNN